MKRVRLTFAFGMVIYFSVVTGWRFPALAQSGDQVRITDLERRVTESDSQHVAERMARMETATDTNTKLSVMIFAAIVLMLVRDVRGITKKQAP